MGHPIYSSGDSSDMVLVDLSGTDEEGNDLSEENFDYFLEILAEFAQKNKMAFNARGIRQYGHSRRGYIYAENRNLAVVLGENGSTVSLIFVYKNNVVYNSNVNLAVRLFRRMFDVFPLYRKTSGWTMEKIENKKDVTRAMYSMRRR